MLLAVSGMGAEKAYAATNLLIRCYPLHGLISIGFAGGLSDAAPAASRWALVAARPESITTFFRSSGNLSKARLDNSRGIAE